MLLEIKDFGICNLSVAPVRASASDASEILTQLLFGDAVEVIEKGQPWVKIRFTADNYEGWMDFKQLTYIDQEEYDKVSSIPLQYLQDPLLTITGPRGKQNIMLGSALVNFKDNTMIFGKEIYTTEQIVNAGALNLIQTSIDYLNTPYLWGGKSIFGIDCSGLVQNIFKVHGKLLPRDASAQVHEGELIAYADRKVGDVPFFINAKGIVHHVGILTKENEIIHAAGCVRLDPFDEKGIFRTDLDKYTHHYQSIRRY
tara:strand:+ start:67721 stop:68488 length:768 start_codon:yes stop_codon:yes gene_type:complete